MGTWALLATALLMLVNACAKPKQAPEQTLASPSASVARPSMPSSLSPAASYMLSLTSDGCSVEVRVNEVPLRRTEAGRRTDYGEVVDSWIWAGVNSVTLEAKGQLAKGCVSLEVLAVPKDGDQRTAPRVLRTSWPAAESTSEARVFEFQGPAADRCRLWREAESIQLTPAAKSELSEQVRMLHRAFTRRDVEALSSSTKYRAEDIARCMGKEPASGIEDQKRFLSIITSEPDFVALPLDEAGLVMDVVANGKLVWLHRRDDVLLLQNKLNQGMDLYAAKIAGRWTIVR